MCCGFGLAELLRAACRGHATRDTGIRACGCDGDIYARKAVPQVQGATILHSPIPRCEFGVAVSLPRDVIPAQMGLGRDPYAHVEVDGSRSSSSCQAGTETCGALLWRKDELPTLNIKRHQT